MGPLLDSGGISSVVPFCILVVFGMHWGPDYTGVHIEGPWYGLWT